MKTIAKILLPIAVVAAGALAAAMLVKAAPEAATLEPTTPPPLVRVIDAVPEDVQLDVTAQGTVIPRTEATLVTQVGGRIVETAPAFAVGGTFRAGQMLVRIDPTDYRLAVARAEAQVAQAETRLAREEAEARVAREEWEELAGSGDGGGDGGTGSTGSTGPADAPDPLVLREPQLAEARAALQAARAQLEQARLDLERTTVEAPFDGRVAGKQVDVGQSVTPGTPIGRVFAVDYAEVPLPVSVADLAYLEVDLAREMDDGPRVELTADLAGARRTWPARIVRTAGTIDHQTRMLGLIARVDRPYGQTAEAAGAPLPMGLFVDATIAGRQAKGVIVLPRSALREGGSPSRSGRAGTTTGLVLVAEDPAGGDEPVRLRFREVEILRLSGDRAVLSGGLAPGEKVAVSPIDTPVDGMAVRLASAGAPPRPPTVPEAEEAPDRTAEEAGR